MECEQAKNAGFYFATTTELSKTCDAAVARQLGRGAGDLRPDGAAVPAGQPLAGAAARAPPPPPLPASAPLPPPPFIKVMDEITYWVHTKRAPCLMNYDNLIKKQIDQCVKPKSVSSFSEEVPTPRKKKRKLASLGDKSSPEKAQNVYFQAPQQTQKTQPSSYKSDSMESDIDFNIKNSSVWDKPKRIKLQKNNKTVLHKKNKVVTSTPIPKFTKAVRRSLRNAQNNFNNNSQLNTTFDEINSNGINNSNVVYQTKCPDLKTPEKVKKLNKPRISEQLARNPATKPKQETPNKAVYDDLSDVSGFTANYIRSTKVHVARPARNLRNKGKRNVMKESHDEEEDSKVVMFVSKSVNVNKEKKANCTASTQNVINVVSFKDDGSEEKINKSTSMLKFVDGKSTKNKESTSTIKKNNRKRNNRNALNVTFHNSSTSRYPKRNRSNFIADITSSSNYELEKSSFEKRASRRSCIFNDSERKENPESESISRTRSGRSIGLSLRQPINSVLVYSNSTEPESSVPNLNVACPSGNGQKKKRKRHLTVGQNSVERSGSLQRDSVRERSGFAACFSESEDDSEALKERKFFC